MVETQYEPCACSPFGKLKRVSRARRLGDPVVWTEYEYDEIGRTTKITHAPVSGTAGNSGITTYAYDVGFPLAQRRATTKVTDPSGRWKTTATDGLGQIRHVIEPRPGGGEYSTSYEYNRLDKLATVYMALDGVAQQRSFEYNAAGELTATVFPETGRTTYTDDSFGRIHTQKDAANRMRKWVYEGGRLREAYTWTPAGQMQQKQLQHRWGSLTASWAYHSDGTLHSMTYPGGTQYTPGWNAAKRMNRLAGGNSW